VWSGADPGATELRGRLTEITGLDLDAPVDEVVAQTYEALATAPSVLVSASLEDILGVTDRPNQPGTVNETNWSLALPLKLEAIEKDERLRRVAHALSRHTLG
jgi:4-alpha-glucanotransferase